jgi:hypothetical protein
LDLKDYIKGCKNEIATLRQEGEYKLTEGKDVLPFDAFIKICQLAIQDGFYDEGHALIVLYWNAMTRSDSIDHSNFQHYSWNSDCVRLEIPKEKMKQSGADPPRQQLLWFGRTLFQICCNWDLSY